MVHSELSKAGSWMRLTEQFLNSPLPNTHGTKVIQTGWSVGKQKTIKSPLTHCKLKDILKNSSVERLRTIIKAAIRS